MRETQSVKRNKAVDLICVLRNTAGVNKQESQKTKLQRLRETRGLTLIQLAEKLKIDVGNLSRIERGIQIPRSGRAKRILEYYGDDLSLEDLMYPEAAA